MPSTADAASREAAWLNSFGETGDGITLPALGVTQGGPWQLIQAYDPRTPPKRQTMIIVTRPEFKVNRFGNIRQMIRYQIHLKLIWPVSNLAGSEETEQQSFDNAVDMLTTRVLGLPRDKTHGGRFLSVAEGPDFLSFVQEEPATSVPSTSSFMAFMTYFADDFEYFD